MRTISQCMTKLFRETVITDDLWDQIHVDYGLEFYLVLDMQEKVRSQRGNQYITPYRQTTSQENHVIERIWVEVTIELLIPSKELSLSWLMER